MRVQVTVHSLVAEAFICSRPDHLVVNHKNGIKKVLVIRQLIRIGGLTQDEIAKLYDVSQPAIHLIATKKTWTTLEGNE